MDVRELVSQSELDTFTGARPGSQFLQSWWWGEFQRAVPRPVMRWGAYEHHRLLGSVQAFEHRLPLGKKYWYIARGPIIDDRLPVEKYSEVGRALLAGVMNAAGTNGAMFVRIDPPWPKSNVSMWQTLTQAWPSRQIGHVQPDTVWQLDITKNEEELLEAMHPKTRYNIKLAERKGVTVRTTETVSDFDDFLKLTDQTARRDKITTHSHEYYRVMHRSLTGKNVMQLFSAEYQGKVIATNIMIFFGDTATYLHGASGDERRELMAPHLLQWRQIQEAKRRGCGIYDFGGVAPAGLDDHPWAGITRFKQGFGGYRLSYLGAYDLILDQVWYTIYKMAQKAILR